MYFVKSFNVENNKEVDEILYFSTMEEVDHYMDEMVVDCTLSRYHAGLKVFLDYVYVHHTPNFFKGNKGYHVYFRVEESELKYEFKNGKGVIERPDSW
ncbi:hypothetical protein V1502_10825 [Bacillus sp. SCS-153A]|uniref:hypothetical protein n=1 Tax=Rossellomorea sedimentorum TaxID=3115294 RepID=UPI003905CCA4